MAEGVAEADERAEGAEEWVVLLPGEDLEGLGAHRLHLMTPIPRQHSQIRGTHSLLWGLAQPALVHCLTAQPPLNQVSESCLCQRVRRQRQKCDSKRCVRSSGCAASGG